MCISALKKNIIMNYVCVCEQLECVFGEMDVMLGLSTKNVNMPWEMGLNKLHTGGVLPSYCRVNTHDLHICPLQVHLYGKILGTI